MVGATGAPVERPVVMDVLELELKPRRAMAASQSVLLNEGARTRMQAVKDYSFALAVGALAMRPGVGHLIIARRLGAG